MHIKIKENIEIESHEMRKTFASVMDELATSDERVIYFDADLMNSIGMVEFQKKFPKRAVNCGIQEANMIGMAAGTSATGMIPFVHTFGTFATRRVIDQVYVSIAFGNLNVRIIGSDPGITGGPNGGTHMANEDIGLIRLIPGITIIEPTDSVMLEDVLHQTKNMYGTFYIRLSRKQADSIYDQGSSFDIGKGIIVREGTDITIISSGIMVAGSLKAAAMLAEMGISAKVVNMFTIKPIDEDCIVKCAEETGAIITAENHNIINGLGSAVAEVLSEKRPTPLRRIGIPDVFGEVGTMDSLKAKFHMQKEDIVAAAKSLVLGQKGE